MTLLERYIHAVQKQLPRDQRDDIAAELRDTLLSQVEAEQARFDRTLSDDEIAAMLQRFGHPMVVASRYGSREYLIGPRMFPYYRMFMRVLVTRVFIPALALATVVSVMLSDHPLESGGRAVWTVTSVGLMLSALVTLVFARIERLGGLPGDLTKWDPRSLPDATGDVTPAPKWEALGSLVMTAFWLMCWMGVIPYVGWVAQLNLRLGGTPLGVELAPVWEVVSPAIILLMVASMVSDSMRLMIPGRTKLYEGLSLLTALNSLIVVYLLLRADNLIVSVTGPGEALGSLFNTLVVVALMIGAVMLAFSATHSGMRMFKAST